MSSRCPQDCAILRDFDEANAPRTFVRKQVDQAIGLGRRITLEESHVMDDESKLLEKLRRIEALHAGAATAGERDAAAEARRRIQARLLGLRDADPPEE
jgi:hypothetical protein